MREVELARLKLAHLREASISNRTSGLELFLCSQAVIVDNHSNDLCTQTTKQKGHVVTSATTTTADLSPSEHVNASSQTITNLFHCVVTSSTTNYSGRS